MVETGPSSKWVQGKVWNQPAAVLGEVQVWGRERERERWKVKGGSNDYQLVSNCKPAGRKGVRLVKQKCCSVFSSEI